MYYRELHNEGSSDVPETDFTDHKLSDARLDAVRRTHGIILRDRPITDMYMQLVTAASGTVTQVPTIAIINNFKTLTHCIDFLYDSLLILEPQCLGRRIMHLCME